MANPFAESLREERKASHHWAHGNQRLRCLLGSVHRREPNGDVRTEDNGTRLPPGAAVCLPLNFAPALLQQVQHATRLSATHQSARLQTAYKLVLVSGPSL